ncbi:hypothetical protein TIFTF001_046874 [Ficus carica]|uniref:Uncharacterized protein n=1 Tax=Ficus carica TaxID=3494 RepID=A0AA87Z543_FICCA|nr:hypothetical protein TIFTF001_046874 [Ficus carica]
MSHIKGKDNVIPDFLSRPAINLITAKHNTIPLIFTITKIPESMASSSSSNLMALFPLTFPKDATAITLSDDPKKKAINRALKIQTKLIQIHGESMVQDFNFHPKYPFVRIFPLRETWFMPKPLTYFFWYLASFYTIAIEVHIVPLRTSIRNFQHRPDLRDAYKTQMDLLSWFAPLSIWDQYLSFEWERFTKRNRPDEVWPKSEEDAPWERFPARYTQQIKRVLDKTNVGPSSTPKTTEPEQAQSIHFQSEGPSLEKEFRFIQWSQDPYSPEPFNPEDFIKLGISPPSSQEQSQSTHNCSFKYHIAQETRVAPQPDTLRVTTKETIPTPPWLTDKFWENEENVQQVLQLIDDMERAETINMSPTHEPINKFSW